jgi:SPP1 family predicted phage head-tail adaptor
MVVPIPDWLSTQGKGMLALLFDRSCDVIRITRASNNAGGSVTSDSVVATYSCAISPVRGRQAEALAARGIVVTTADQQVTLPLEADVQATDKLEIDDVRFDVVNVSMPASVEFARIVIARRAG